MRQPVAAKDSKEFTLSSSDMIYQYQLAQMPYFQRSQRLQYGPTCQEDSRFEHVRCRQTRDSRTKQIKISAAVSKG